MPIIGWSEYNCPDCGRNFGDSDIAKIRFMHECPYCNKPVHINGHKALQGTKTAAFLFIITVGIIIVVAFSSQQGKSILDFYDSLTNTLKIFFVIFAVSLGYGIGALIVYLYKNQMLKSAYKKLEKKKY